MLIDNKGKLFGKLSIIDIGIVALIIVLAIGTYFRFYGNGKSNSNIETVKIRYVVEIREIRKFSVDAINVNDIIGDIESNKVYGKIVKKEVEDFKSYINDLNGNANFTSIPNRYKVKLTIEADGKAMSDGYFINGKEFKVSDIQYSFRSTNLQFGGFIYDISKT